MGNLADRFRRDGYVVVDPFFSDHEVAALQSGVRELIDAGKLHNVATDFDRQTRREARSTCRSARCRTTIRSSPRCRSTPRCGVS